MLIKTLVFRKKTDFRQLYNDIIVLYSVFNVADIQELPWNNVWRGLAFETLLKHLFWDWDSPIELCRRQEIIEWLEGSEWMQITKLFIFKDTSSFLSLIYQIFSMDILVVPQIN